MSIKTENISIEDLIEKVSNYDDNLEDFVTKKAMTRKTKCRIMMTVTLLMCIGLVTMGLKGIMTGCIVLSIIWVFHVVYFWFGVKTI